MQCQERCIMIKYKSMGPQIIPPPGNLKNYVRYFRIPALEDTGDERTLQALSDPYPGFDFRDVHGHSHIKTDNRPDTSHIFLTALDSRSQTFTIHSAYSHTGICSYPHALNCFCNIEASGRANPVYSLVFYIPPFISDQLYEYIRQ